MDDFNLPLENRDFVRAFVNAIGITGCEVTPSYIKAVRTDGKRPLNIAPGWSNGFIDEAEARAATGDTMPVWDEPTRKGVWGVSHPINWIGRNGSSTRNGKPVDFGLCPVHGQQLAGTGKCWMCEDD